MVSYQTFALGVATLSCVSTRFGSGIHIEAAANSFAVPALKVIKVDSQLKLFAN